jgi:hypothetical protein
MCNKTVAVLVGVAIVGLSVGYLVQRFEVERLQAENRSLLARQAQAMAMQGEAIQVMQSKKDELERIQRDSVELLRLRNEVAQLRRERDAQKENPRDLTPPSRDTVQNDSEPGPYISKEQLAFVGYATPEVALQSMIWAMLKGTYEQANAALGPEMLKHELEDENGREHFEAGRKALGPLFKGMQILARRTLSEDRVELNLKMDADSPPDSQEDMPPFLIQPMVKVGSEWKLGGSTRGGYLPDWEDGAEGKTGR